MSIRVARNETSGWARACRRHDRGGQRSRIWARSAGPPVGRGNAAPDKRERQSRAISKRPITGERSWKKKNCTRK